MLAILHCYQQICHIHHFNEFLVVASAKYFQTLSCRTIKRIKAHFKKIRRFYGKIPGNQLPVHFPLFLRASACRTFLEIKKW